MLRPGYPSSCVFFSFLLWKLPKNPSRKPLSSLNGARRRSLQDIMSRTKKGFYRKHGIDLTILQGGLTVLLFCF